MARAADFPSVSRARLRPARDGVRGGRAVAAFMTCQGCFGRMPSRGRLEMTPLKESAEFVGKYFNLRQNPGPPGVGW